MGIFTTESIDTFIANGITESAEYIGIDVSEHFKDDMKKGGDKTAVLCDYVSAGNSVAYLVYIVSDSFKNGFPSNRVFPFVCEGKASYIFSVVETAKDTMDYLENRDYIVPLLKDVADFLLLSMSVNPLFLSTMQKHYSIDNIEFKASAYYEQASRDVSKINKDEGLASVLSHLAHEFEKYLVVMKRFSHEKLNQQIVNKPVFKKRIVRFRKHYS